MKRLLLAVTFSTTLLTAAIVSANSSALHTVATFDALHPPGNIAITPSGRKFLSIHGFYGQKQKIMELLGDGTTKPYPNAEWAYAYNNGKGFYDVLGINVSADGVLWMLDTSGPDHAGRLVGWNTNTEQLHKVIYLAKPTITDTSFLNDLAVDNKNGYIVDGGGNVYVTDITNGAIGVVKPSGDYEVLFKDERLVWPDGFSYGADHKIYFTVNKLHRSPVLNNGKDVSASLLSLIFTNMKINYPCSVSRLFSLENVSSLPVPFAPHPIPWALVQIFQVLLHYYETVLLPMPHHQEKYFQSVKGLHYDTIDMCCLKIKFSIRKY